MGQSGRERPGARTLSAVEERVVAAVHEERDGLVELLGELVACDTTARDVDDDPRDEQLLQRILAARLRDLGAEIDLWEAEPTGAGTRHLPGGLGFSGRPQLAASLPGGADGRSLLMLGHIDAVSADPVERWTADPFALTRRDGRLYGRGTADMKGGLAAMLAALEAVRRCDVRLEGDVTYCAVTDEESSGAGGFAAVARGIRADGGICAEPSDFDAWVACRGSLTPVITLPGRPGHAEMPQPHWRDGGAVNAIEKLPLVLDAVRRLREDWRGRADQRHPYLDPGDIVPTIVRGGEWEVTYPADCRLTCEVTYLPAHVGPDGTGRELEHEIREAVLRACAADTWLAENPPEWLLEGDVVPAEMPADHPLVGVVLEAGAACGRPGKVAGFGSWHDGATFIRHGDTPTLCFGPGVTNVAHTVDEWVAEDDLVDAAAAMAVATLRWCGVSR
jgi:acetylornithine deacetylase